jgi:hypothetical protein
MWREAKVILYKTLTKSHVLYSLGMYALLIYTFDLAPARSLNFPPVSHFSC